MKTFSRMTALICLLVLVIAPACSELNVGDVVIRVGILPILDVLPLSVAESQGYYSDHNVHVELVYVASAAERDQLFQAGQLDVMITDLVALHLANRNEPQLVGVRYAMRPTEGHPQFSIIASPKSEMTTPSELADIDIGLSEATVIEYSATRMLESVGVSGDAFQPLAVPKIPERLALLNEGGIQAAVLPEPLASLAVAQGGYVLLDDTSPAMQSYSCSIYAVRSSFLEEHSTAIKSMLGAIDQAIEDINADKSLWESQITELKLVPEMLQDSFVLPDYPGANIPTTAMFVDVTQWLVNSKNISSLATYESSLSADFIE